jgi:hypothetical protein
VNRHINLIPMVGLSVVAFASASASAAANPLLSGYGGPGQGSQAILGSALVNGPRGGGGGSGGATGSAALARHSGGGVGGAAAGVTRNGASAAAARAQGNAPPRSASGAGGQADRQPSAVAVDLYPASERAGNAEGALGLSADDLLYIVLALGSLAFAGVFTRRLARARPPRERAGS